MRAQQGDHAAFQQLASAMARRLYVTATLILRDGDLANDAVQETLIQVWRNLPGLRDPQAFDAWVRRILVRQCYRAISVRRKHRLEVEVASIEDLARPFDSRIDESDQLERAFRRLSLDHRAVLVLHHREGLELAETAVALNIPVGTVKSRLNRATLALRAAFDAEERAAATLLEGQTA